MLCICVSYTYNKNINKLLIINLNLKIKMKSLKMYANLGGWKKYVVWSTGARVAFPGWYSDEWSVLIRKQMNDEEGEREWLGFRNNSVLALGTSARTDVFATLQFARSVGWEVEDSKLRSVIYKRRQHECSGSIWALCGARGYEKVRPEQLNFHQYSSCACCFDAAILILFSLVKPV